MTTPTQAKRVLDTNTCYSVLDSLQILADTYRAMGQPERSDAIDHLRGKFKFQILPHLLPAVGDRVLYKSLSGVLNATVTRVGTEAGFLKIDGRVDETRFTLNDLEDR